MTIPVQLPDELAQRLLPLQDRLPEIIELGLRQLVGDETIVDAAHAPTQVIDALMATGLVTLPTSKRRRHTSRRPVAASGPPASEMIIAERRSSYAAEE